MSETPASLRRKIDGAQDLQSVVKTMKALAASNIGQYERSVRALGDYLGAVELGLSVCLQRRTAVAAPMAPTPAGGRAVHVIVFGSDQGLVGQFNDVIATYALEQIAKLPGEPRVWAVGERVHAHLSEAHVRLMECFHVPNSVQAITPLIGQILLAGEEQRGAAESIELHTFHNQPALGAAYAPVGQCLLPLDEDWRRRLLGLEWPTRSLPEVVGETGATLSALVREYLFISLFRACAESLASENGSRLAAMQRAEKNIGDRLEELGAKFHSQRQSSIDEELFDVIAGYEALS